MITNALEFPCVEASRCYLTEKEHGLRLTLTKTVPDNKSKHDIKAMTPRFFFGGGGGNSNSTTSTPSNTTRDDPAPSDSTKTEPTYRLEFTKQRNLHSEWYVHLHTTPTEEGMTMRSVQFKHILTGKYLHSTGDGTVGTQDFASHWTVWLMEPVGSVTTASSFNTSSSSPTYGVTRMSPSNGGARAFSFGDVNSHSKKDRNMAVYYSLLPKAFAPRKLAYTKQNAVAGGLELITTTSGKAAVWELEFTSGELCFISNPVLHSQVRCNLFGQIHLSSVFQGWEVFRFIEVGYGHVAISSWTHSHKYLSSDPDGKVFTSENRLGHWEKWRLEKAENAVHIVSIAHPERYLSIGKEEGEALHTTTRPSDFAKWHLDAAHANVYYLCSVSSDNKPNLQVTSNRKGPFLTKNRRDWEEWKMERTSKGDITLCSRVHEKYLGCNSNGEVHTTSTRGDWSLWELEESSHGGIYLKSKAHQRVLAVQKDTLYTTLDSYTEMETFRLEPRLPATISGHRLAALGAAGAVGIALTVAMPYAILGAMEAAGLAATELSILAGVSAEVLAGIGGGALLGVGVVGTTAAVFKDKTQDPNLSPTAEVKDDYLIGVQRPISAWRTW